MELKKYLIKYQIICSLFVCLHTITILIILTPWDPIIHDGVLRVSTLSLILIAYLIISCIWISFLEDLQKCPEYHQYRVEVTINIIRFFGYPAPRTDIDFLIKPRIGNITLLRSVWSIMKTENTVQL